MAHIQPKSGRSAEHKREFKLAEDASIAKQTRTHRDAQASETRETKGLPQTSTAADEGNSWQFKFVIAVIAAGVLMLILKTIGLF